MGGGFGFVEWDICFISIIIIPPFRLNPSWFIEIAPSFIQGLHRAKALLPISC